VRVRRERRDRTPTKPAFGRCEEWGGQTPTG
jgi:hypothetical protein